MKQNTAESKKRTTPPTPTLRQRAEAQLHALPKGVHRTSTGDMQRVVHELQVTQVELQLQNEDLRQTQVDLELARDRYRELYDYAPVGYVTLTREGVILEANLTSAHLFGEARATLIGTLLSRSLTPESRDTFYDHLRQVGATKQPGVCKVMAQLPNERRLLLQLNSTAVSDEQGTVQQCRTVLLDVTTREQTESALRQMQEKAVENERLAVIGVTAAKLAHEIGNPLNSMMLSLQMLERRLVSTASEDNVMERVRGLRDHVTRLSNLLNEFRHLSRRQNYRLVPLDLTGLVTEVLTAEKENYAARGVTIAHDTASELPLVNADADKLRQVLVNLCKNAVEAMPDGGTLTVRVQHDGDNQVQLHITDTGSGIPEDVNIFEPFITTKPEGTGLGLPVVRQIVAAHGGELTYRSTMGQGTTFTVSLRAADENPHAPTVPSAPS